MNAKELRELGLTDEALIEKIIVSHGQDIEKHKGLAKAAEDRAAALEAQLGEKDKAVTQAQTEAQAQVSKLKLNTAIERALERAKAKNLKAARAILDETDLALAEDGTVTGLDERVAKVAADNAYLFGDDKPAETKVIPRVVSKTTNTPPTPGDPLTDAIRKGAGLPPVKVR